MSFKKIRIPELRDFLRCSVATTVLSPAVHEGRDIRNLGELGRIVEDRGFDWCVANRDPKKPPQWWRPVQDIRTKMDWELLEKGDPDPITAKIHEGALEFGSLRGFGGGCHRSIAIAALAVDNPEKYRPFEILLEYFEEFTNMGTLRIHIEYC